MPETTLSRRDYDQPWIEQGNCRDYDAEIFFPQKGESPAAAKAVCGVCPVRIECLNYALREDDLYGVWGGLSERSRSRLKKLAQYAT